MGLLLGHAAFDQIEVLQTFVHRTVAQFDAAAGRGVGQVRRRDVQNISFASSAVFGPAQAGSLVASWKDSLG